ncbi:MAG: Dps family protein [Bacteroidota bacterium]
MDINIGIAEAARSDIANGLKKLLADTYALYVKTHNFHWNVEGPMFNTLHEMFEGQYTEMAEGIDVIAERIRALGVYAPGSFSQFSELSSIEDEREVPTANEMIRKLLLGQETVVRTARQTLPIAGDANDEPTVDLLTARMQTHEKNAWMLRSLLE